jgi:hypothetical protein
MAERRISQKDFDEVEKFINEEMESRERNAFRKKTEKRWKEIDRQIEMEAIQRKSIDGRPLPKTWHSEFELGELTKASEIITADAMRMLFPEDRTWFEPHVQVEGQIDPNTGTTVIQADKQETADDRLRALMSQQHLDFGFKARFELSIKESLHHGSFGAEVRWEPMLLAQGGSLRNVAAPVWVPYSMWNTFPDPSPSVVGTNLFYTGSMIFVEYMPLWKLKRVAAGQGWLPKRLEQVDENQTHKLESAADAETNDVKLVKFFGDLSISRKRGEDIFLPNCEAICANGKLIFVKANEETPYPRVVFAGYERTDVRNPYYTSPIIKNSPIQKFTSVALNRFVDVAELYAEPPVEYDANDPDYAASGGPIIAPGAKNATKSMGKGFKTLEIGDPRFLLEAGQMGVRMLEQGTGVSALRQGTQSNERQTATEIMKLEQGAEVRTVDFVSKLGPSALRPFLYMQHDLNRSKLQDYPCYVNEMKSQDYMIFTNEDVNVNATFDVVGARSMLGEQQRKQQMTQVTFAAAGSPLFAPLLNAQRILLDMYRDAGKKNPEEWVKGEQQVDPAMQAQHQKMMQAIQQLAEENKQLKTDRSVDMEKIQKDFQAKMAALQQTGQIKERELALEAYTAKVKAAAEQADVALREMELRLQAAAQAIDQTMAQQSQRLEQAIAMSQMVNEQVEKMQSIKPTVVIPRRKRKVKKDERGNVIEIEEMDVGDIQIPPGGIVMPPRKWAVKYSPDDDLDEIEEMPSIQ